MLLCMHSTPTPKTSARPPSSRSLATQPPGISRIYTTRAPRMRTHSICYKKLNQPNFLSMGAKNTLHRILGGCDGDSLYNPMNRKYGGEYDTEGYRFTTSITRTNRPWPCYTKPVGNCQAWWHIFYASWYYWGGSWSSSDYRQQTLPGEPAPIAPAALRPNGGLTTLTNRTRMGSSGTRVVECRFGRRIACLRRRRDLVARVTGVATVKKKNLSC